MISFQDAMMLYSFSLQKEEVTLFPLGETLRWCRFVAKLHKEEKEIPRPYSVVDRLVTTYLDALNRKPVLDIGCETGKNACVLVEGGHHVVLNDIAPNAVMITEEYIKSLQLIHRVAHSLIGRIEIIDLKKDAYKAVVGTFVFSFIPQNVTKRILKTVESGGYFAGGFFGKEHCWANDPTLTFFDKKELRDFFASRKFKILELTERKISTATVYEGDKVFHIFDLIAKKG